MKKQFIIVSLSAMTALSAVASPIRNLAPVPAGTPNAITPLNEAAYYATPMGVTFKGADKDEEFDGNYAFAPVSTWLETAAEVKGGSFEWRFSDGFDAQGTEIFATSTATDFRFRERQACVTSAPLLTVKSASSDATYTMATSGICYGEIGTATNYAVNYQPDYTTRFDVAPEVLNVNDKSATDYLNLIMAMSGSLFSNIKVLGFSESFYDCGKFYLENISAEIYSEAVPTVDDVMVKVFHRERTSVSTEEIAQLVCTDIYATGDNRYYVTFSCDEPTLIESAMQVVVMPANDDFVFSPVVPLQAYYRGSNAGTAAFYANFSLAGRPCVKQYLDFFGTETTDDNDKVLGYINHWAIGIKGSYDKPSSGIDDITIDNHTDDDTVYNLAGVAVGQSADVLTLPAGLYICNGKKFIVR